MTTDHRIIVRDNYNAVAQRVAAEWALLHAPVEFNPVQLAYFTNTLIDELKQQRDEARAALRTIGRIAAANGEEA